MQVGDYVGALLVVLDAGEGHGGAGDIAARVGQELVELVIGPAAALGLHRRGEVEAAAFPALAADDVPEIGPDSVRAALGEGVAGFALLGGRLALVDGGFGQALRQRHFFRRGGGLLPARLGFHGDDVAGFGRLFGGENGASGDVERERDQTGAEDGAEDFVELEGVHRNMALGRAGRPCGTGSPAGVPAAAADRYRFACALATRISAAGTRHFAPSARFKPPLRCPTPSS